MKSSKRNIRGLSDRVGRRRRRGAVTVEFSVVAPVLTIFFLGMIDAGQFVNVGQAVSSASREGARLAARCDTLNVTDVESSVLSYLAYVYPNVPQATLDAALQVNVSDAADVAIPGGDLTSIGTGSPVSVEVVFQFEPVRWLSGLSSFDNQVLSMTSEMRRE